MAHGVATPPRDLLVRRHTCEGVQRPRVRCVPAQLHHCGVEHDQAPLVCAHPAVHVVQQSGDRDDVTRQKAGDAAAAGQREACYKAENTGVE